jgi:hypothetical protein
LKLIALFALYTCWGLFLLLFVLSLSLASNACFRAKPCPILTVIVKQYKRNAAANQQQRDNAAGCPETLFA